MTWSERFGLRLTDAQEWECERYATLHNTVVVRPLPDGTAEVLDPTTARMERLDDLLLTGGRSIPWAPERGEARRDHADL